MSLARSRPAPLAILLRTSRTGLAWHLVQDLRIGTRAGWVWTPALRPFNPAGPPIFANVGIAWRHGGSEPGE